ncbi:MAG: hypothetical protein K9K66_14855 [Desulfarculaceae bacterium]|nr:hypothetical protein [Desulfarculaceae bacterium]MCF8072472.1 hypothetical protein [Desulfarculaceae bacterium]MCF8102933.1 hypothetical protein [Desulfarculaceae bacterium]MCF8117464.1 hypothetical protein [Desulfarculaceae bacterium]
MIMLLPQDIMVLLKLVLQPGDYWTYAEISHSLGLSPSQVHASVTRATDSRLFSQELRRPILDSVEEFLIHGVKYSFPAEIGRITRGMPTAHSHPAFLDKFPPNPEESYVWPWAEGDARGMSFSPLYKSAPEAARNDSQLYLALALVDALRLGRKRENSFARNRLIRWIRGSR